jgi:acetyltransferase-like isoleucine patch superfamily enzyme
MRVAADAVIHPAADVHPDTRFEGQNEVGRATVKHDVTFGLGSYVGDYSFIGQWTDIGRFCSIANNATIAAQPHPLDWLSTNPALRGEAWVRAERRTVIGHDVWICANAVVLAGVEIGIGAVVGAGAVVLSDVAPYTIVVGAPALWTGDRFDEKTVDRLLASEWWNLPIERLRELPVRDIEAALEMIEVARASAGNIDRPWPTYEPVNPR